MAPFEEELLHVQPTSRPPSEDHTSGQLKQRRSQNVPFRRLVGDFVRLVDSRHMMRREIDEGNG